MAKRFIHTIAFYLLAIVYICVADNISSTSSSTKNDIGAKEFYTAATRVTNGGAVTEAIYISIAVFFSLVALCFAILILVNIFKCIRKKLRMKKYVESNQNSNQLSTISSQLPAIQPGTSRDVTII